MPITTERLLTSPNAFGLTTANPAQRAFCRIVDGLPLDELAADPNVERMVGGPEAVAFLDRARRPPIEVYLVAAVRCGKSLISAASAVRMALTCDLSRLRPLEVARVSIVSLDRDKALVVMAHLREGMFGSALKPMLVGQPKAFGLTIRREDGRLVEIAVVAGKAGGGNLISRWCAGVIFDEGPRMQGQGEGIVNLDHQREAVLARLSLIEGSQMLVPGSPWAPRGPVYDAVNEHWGKPTDNFIVVRATGPEFCPQTWTPEEIARVRALDEMSYRTDVLGEFADPESSLYTAAELEACTRKAPIEALPDPQMQYVAAMDPATRRNAWTLVIAGMRFEAGMSRVVVAVARQWVPTQEAPLLPEVVLAEIRDVCARYGVLEVFTDQWASDSNSAIARMLHFTVTESKRSTAEMVTIATGLHNAATSGGLELPPVPGVKADLLAVRKQVTNLAQRLLLPITADGRHCDFAPALWLAFDILGATPSWVMAMDRLKREGGSLFFTEDDGTWRCDGCKQEAQKNRNSDCICGAAAHMVTFYRNEVSS